MLRNKYLAIFLSILAIIVVYFSFFRGFILKKQVKPVAKSPVAMEEAPKTQLREVWDLNAPFNLERIASSPSEEWGRDIFKRVVKGDKEEELLMGELPKLTAILADSKRVVAILNGQIVKEGDRIDGILVKRILKNSVIIDRGAGEEHVYIFNLQKGGQFEENK